MTRTPSTRRTTLAAAAASLVLLAAAGCTSTASAGGSTEPAEIATYDGAEVAFGESYTYDNGLVIEVKQPTTYVPTEFADGTEGLEGVAVKVRVNVINGTSTEYVPDTMGVQVVSGGEDAVQIHDPGAAIELTGPSRALGRADVVAFDLAFVVLDPQDVTVSLTPSLGGYAPVVFSKS